MRRQLARVWGAATGSLIGTVTIALIGICTTTISNADAGAVSPEALVYWQSPDSLRQEEYVHEKMPPGFQVIGTELEGPVFADDRRRTMYTWPLHRLRNGSTGDRKDGSSMCTDKVLRVSSGLMSPYPAGLLLPDLDQRPSCADVWPPVLASEAAEPVGKWTLTEREDGSKQWAYDGFPLYTSILDRQPGDVLGATKLPSGGDSPAIREPAGPEPAVPAMFEVIPMATGRLLVTEDRSSVYAWDGDEPNKSNCYDECLMEWAPIPAPEGAVEQGEWTVVKRSPGISQWAFWGEPLYTYRPDSRTLSLTGGDVPGWHNVFTQRALPPPAGFTVQDARIGQVLADADGMTIYLYNCGDDAFDQLACDHPSTSQAFRLAICGNGDPELCRETFPYVVAPADAKSPSRLWSVMAINPKTGRRADPGQADVLQVWAYRDRPVYNYGGDHKPGDTNGDAYGEFNGHRNGYKAFWLRDDFLNNAFSR